MLFPSPLVAQNYSHSRGNPIGIPWKSKFPFTCTPLHAALIRAACHLQLSPVVPKSCCSQVYFMFHITSPGVFCIALLQGSWQYDSGKE